MGANTSVALRNQYLSILGIADNPNYSESDLETLVFNMVLLRFISSQYGFVTRSLTDSLYKPSVQVKDYYVTKSANANDANDGLSAANAFATLAHAVTQAVANGGLYRINLGVGNFPLPANTIVWISGSHSLIGAGAGWNGTALTTIDCSASAGTGLKVSSGNGGECSGFLVDGGGVSTVPLMDGDTTVVGGNRSWHHVVVTRSAGNGWTIMGSQNASYWNCLSFSNALDNLYMDFGCGGLNFYNFNEFNAGRYGIHGDNLVAGGPFTAGPQCVRFWGGTWDDVKAAATSQVYLRHCTDFKFPGVSVDMSANGSGPLFDIDCATCNMIDLGKVTTFCAVTGGGANPGHSVIQLLAGSGRIDIDHTWFLAGDTSIYMPTGACPNVVAGNRMIDGTVNGPVSGGAAIDPLLKNRNGKWIVVGSGGSAPAFTNSWVSNDSTIYNLPAFRILADNRVELRGTAKSGATGTSIFTLPVGYRPLRDYLVLVISSGGPAYIAINTDGTVTANNEPGGSVNTAVWFDNVCFDLN